MLRSAAVLALALAALAPGVARADGDPASDVLYTQGVFVPQDAGAPPADITRLAALVRESRRAGYPVKVAVVASSYDLGSVTALWRRPQTYAHFLGVELSLLYRGRLLTVMPNGLGVYHHGQPVTRETAVLRGVEVDRGNLVATAATAVQRLAAADGHRLAVPVAAPAASEHRRRRLVARDLGRIGDRSAARRGRVGRQPARPPAPPPRVRPCLTRGGGCGTFPLAKSLWALGFTGTRHFWGRFLGGLSPRRTSSSSSRGSRTPSRRA